MTQHILITNQSDPTLLDDVVLQHSPHDPPAITFGDGLRVDQTIPPLTNDLQRLSTIPINHFPIGGGPTPFAVTTFHSPGPSIVRLTNSPGMGLPIELWLYILTFLARDAMSLLACALTCTWFRYDAEDLIRELYTWEVDPTKYSDLDELLEGIYHSRYGNIIRILKVGTQWKSDTSPLFPRVLSVIPLQLSRRLPLLYELIFHNLIINPQPCPSRWILYGRAFSNVATIRLKRTQFPLFEDVVSLITSFPAISELHLDSVSCNERRILSHSMRESRKPHVVFKDLGIRGGGFDNGYWFQAAFVQWLVRWEIQVPGLIDFDMISPKYTHSPIIPDPHPFLLNPAHPHRSNAFRLRDVPGMGLTIELWEYIITFLSCDVMSLLACALTCRRLRGPAEGIIRTLRDKIYATRYDDLNNLVEALRTEPKFARAVDHLKVEGGSLERIPVVLSVLPIRLSSLLISLRELEFWNFTVESQPYPSRWSLYGRAFPNLTKLHLANIRFPSLKDSVALITSFPALTTLVLRYLQLGSPVIPMCVFTCSNKRRLMLHTLEIQDYDTSSFLSVFIPWFARRNVRILTLNLVSECIFSESCRQLLSHSREHLQGLELLFCTGQTPKQSPEKLASKTQSCILFGTRIDFYPAEIRRLGFPALSSSKFPDLIEPFIPWFLAIIVPHASQSLKTMEIEVKPTSKDLESFAWTRLDVVLSSWFMINHAKNNSKLALILDRKHSDFKGLSIESLFPLTTSLGKSRWGTFNTLSIW
ncbi:hypothetical protein NLI96_g8738 [Meripilus lineatus]|uniref:F-box domain-containing protein n=1 Tax=Meripilus lineatus TaxID=2056292 RepID=A0AAD5V1Z6_9APHY|nr:hypothetical protein NLI96_g8738 [Physisporinus lineatus]